VLAAANPNGASRCVPPKDEREAKRKTCGIAERLAGIGPNDTGHGLSEFDWDGRSVGSLDVEERPGRKPEHRSDHAAWENLSGRVVGKDGIVVELASEGDSALGIAELLLQVKELLTRSQGRIGLRNRKEALQRVAEEVLGFRLCRWSLRPHCADSSLSHGLEGLSLVDGVSLDRLNEIRHQVVTALELDSDLAPRIIHAVSGLDQPVVSEDQNQPEKQSNDNDDLKHAHPASAASARVPMRPISLPGPAGAPVRGQANSRVLAGCTL